MTRQSSTTQWFSILVLLLSCTAVAKESVGSTEHNTDTLTEKTQLLDQLLKAGLISPALYARRQAALTQSFTHEYRQTTPSELAQPTSLVTAPIQRFVALVIGSNEYKHLESLDTAINDARAVSELLEQKFGFDVQLLENATRHELLSALSKWRKTLKVHDNFLLFYAGHGYFDNSNNRGYWLPVDAEADNPANWVSTVEISDALLALPAANALVIADSCFAGALGGDISKDTDWLPASRENSVEQPRSRTAITSGGLEPVLDTIDGRHSVFTSAFIEQMNHYQQGMTIKTIFERTAGSVRRQVDQTPGYFTLPDAGHQSGEFTLPAVE